MEKKDEEYQEEEEGSNSEEDKESEYKKIHCRMYEENYPKENDLVYCKVDEILEYGAYVKLLEYDGIRGFIFSREISRKRVNFVNRLLKIGKEEVLRVIRVDVKGGFIDLSKKQVKSDEIEECKKFYSKSKHVDCIMRLLAVHCKEELLTLNKKIAWPLYKKYEHAFNGFKAAMEGDETVLKDLDVSEDIKNELMNILKVRMVQQPVKIRSDFRLTCYTFEGIDAIKEALLNGEKKSTPNIPIKFRVIGAPIYECTITTTNKNEGIKVLTDALLEVEKTIKQKNGGFLLITNPIVLGNFEESMSEQMKEAVKEKQEEEKEVEEENQEGIQANIEEKNDDEDLKMGYQG